MFDQRVGRSESLNRLKTGRYLFAQFNGSFFSEKNHKGRGFYFQNNFDEVLHNHDLTTKISTTAQCAQETLQIGKYIG